MKCPLCDFVLLSDRPLNELIKHLSSHGKLKDVLIGEEVLIFKINGVQYAIDEEENERLSQGK